MTIDQNPLLETEFGPDENSGRKILDDASDVAKINRKRRKKEIAEANENAFLKKALEDREGRKFLWDILESGQAFKAVVGFTPNGSESPIGTAYAMGQQLLVTSLYHKWLFAFPQLVYLMLAENDDRFALAGSKQSKAIVTNARPGPESDAD